MKHAIDHMSKRLLLVEDSPTQLITLRSMLESSGYTILSSKSASEGLVRAYNELPDLIISDVVMAGINGYQLCRLVKSDPELSTTPVILLTKLDGSVDRFWGMKSGADRFIPKEPGYPSLIKAVRELLETTKSEPKLRLVGEPSQSPTAQEINARLNQLLERLLFEATIVDEVRKLSEETVDLNILAGKLFELLSSILDYEACALIVNEGSHSSVFTDCAKHVSEAALTTYVSNLSLQLGLPPLKSKLTKQLYYPSNSITQPIDVQGGRLGLLVVVPLTNSAYQPGDQKVVRIICDQLSIILRIFRLHKRSQEVQNNTV